jgi:hypothetical protein
LIDLKLLELTCNANALFMNPIGKPNNDFAKEMDDSKSISIMTLKQQWKRWSGKMIEMK